MLTVMLPPISDFTRAIAAPNLSVIRSNEGLQFATKHLVVGEWEKI
jgi:hypothetical protein